MPKKAVITKTNRLKPAIERFIEREKRNEGKFTSKNKLAHKVGMTPFGFNAMLEIGDPKCSTLIVLCQVTKLDFDKLTPKVKVKYV